MSNIYVRLITYILSLPVGAVPAWAAGWLTITVVDGWIQIGIEINGALTALSAAIGISMGVFKRWGVK